MTDEWKSLKLRSSNELKTTVDEDVQRIMKIGRLGALQSLTGGGPGSLVSMLAIQAKIQSCYFELILRELQELRGADPKAGDTAVKNVDELISTGSGARRCKFCTKGISDDELFCPSCGKSQS